MMPSRATGRLIVFARVPRLGEVKTRLAAAIGARQALDVYVRLLDTTLATARRFADEDSGIELELCVAGGDADESMAARAARAGMRLCPQSDGDLGQRMMSALNRALVQGLPAVLIGTDCPVIAPRHLHWAFRSLAAADAVFVPVEDGGYVLVGLRRNADSLFSGIDWSTDRVMAQTRDRARAARLAWREGELLWDVDSEPDLLRWQGSRQPDQARAGLPGPEPAPGFEAPDGAGSSAPDPWPVTNAGTSKTMPSD